MRQRPDSKLWIVALVAQGIEQDGPNVKVGGSIPSGGTKCIFQRRPQEHIPAWWHDGRCWSK